jgi:thioredoxin reductase (NADPH)
MPGFPRLKASYDFVIVGGGHAGLQAGLKAALLNYTAIVIDRGPKFSRSYYAPRMDNIPGFPNGISGHKLLDLQIEALHRVEEKVGYFTPATAVGAQRDGTGFHVAFEWLKQRQIAHGKVLILALGVVDRIPVVGGKIDPIFPWANFGIVDFCILCDGHELPGKSVAVLGHDAFAARTALDLTHFGPGSLEMLTHGAPFLAGVEEPTRTELEQALEKAHITHFDGVITGFDGIREKRFVVRFADGSSREYDKGFSGLGWYRMNSELPRSLGCAFDPEEYVLTDDDSRALSATDRTPIPGLYCVGDQRSGWNQIPEAWATAERAVIHAYAEYL